MSDDMQEEDDIEMLDESDDDDDDEDIEEDDDDAYLEDEMNDEDYDEDIEEDEMQPPPAGRGASAPAAAAQPQAVVAAPAPPPPPALPAAPPAPPAAPPQQLPPAGGERLEEDAALVRRRAIQAIMRDTSLSEQDKRMQIQNLMSGGRTVVACAPAPILPSQQAGGAAAAASANAACVHYERNCNVRVSCCIASLILTCMPSTHSDHIIFVCFYYNLFFDSFVSFSLKKTTNYRLSHRVAIASLVVAFVMMNSVPRIIRP
jgi:hypothetical protein